LPARCSMYMSFICLYIQKTSMGSLCSFCSYFVYRYIELSSSILRVNRLWRIKETQIKLGIMPMFLQNYICVSCYKSYFFKSFFNNIELKILFLSLNIFQYCKKVFKQKSYVIFSHELVTKILNYIRYCTHANCEISFFTYYVT
jgi:hypothetical protein